MISLFVTSASNKTKFADISVSGWAWVGLLVFISAVLLLDLLVFHRKAHVIGVKEALRASLAWIFLGVAFTGFIAWHFNGAAAGEYISGYLIEKSLSVDNVFVWALILSFYKIPPKFQHRVLFWGIFGALVLRAIFIFAGVALIEKFSWVLYLFGAFLVFTGIKLVFESDEEMDPASSRLMRIIRRFVPTSSDYDGQKLFTSKDGIRLVTPLFAVLLLVEMTDILFAVDSVPAVLAVSREQFIVFSSNAFAIFGLRALYFLLADAHARFSRMKQGLAVILIFVGVKMVIHRWYGIPTWLSLVVIVIVLMVAIGFSMKAERDNPSASPVD
jgi:tellurite resistance protein TerC